MLQFWLLWDRRRINFQKQCYANAITAAAIYNTRRAEGQRLIDPMELVPRPAEEARIEEVTSMLQGFLASVKPDRIAAVRAEWRKNLTEKGLPADDILADVFNDG